MSGVDKSKSWKERRYEEKLQGTAKAEAWLAESMRQS